MEWKEMNKSMNANGMESINAAPRAPTARGKPTTQQFSFFAGWRSEAKQRMDELVELAEGVLLNQRRGALQANRGAIVGAAPNHSTQINQLN